MNTDKTGIQHKNQAFFLEWINGFLTFNRMASFYGLGVEEVATKVRKGRCIHESQFGPYVFDVTSDHE